jgi:hypothetical protein
MVLCLMAACSKHHDKPVDGGHGPYHGPVIRLKTAGANAHTYDSLGRLIRTDFSASVTGRSEFTYNRDSVVEKDYDQQGRRQGPIIIYYLNSDTLATKARYILDPSVPALFFNITYDADRRLIEELAGDEGSPADTHVVNYYSNGNVDSTKLFSVSTGRLVETTRFEYYTDKHNWLNDVYNGISYLGAGSANLLKRQTDIQTNDTSVIEYTYAFDADSRPIRRHATFNGEVWGPDIDYTWVTLQL